MKVMMVRLACYFIACGLAWERDRIEPALRQQRLDIAIHGGNTQSFVVALRGAQRLLGRKRAVCLDKGIADGLLLSGVARDRLRHTF